MIFAHHRECGKMNAEAKVAEIEKKLTGILAGDPYHVLLVMQLGSIARTAIKSATNHWRKHDKRPTCDKLPDLFIRS